MSESPVSHIQRACVRVAKELGCKPSAAVLNTAGSNPAAPTIGRLAELVYGTGFENQGAERPRGFESRTFLRYWRTLTPRRGHDAEAPKGRSHRGPGSRKRSGELAELVYGARFENVRLRSPAARGFESHTLLRSRRAIPVAE